MSIIPEQKNTGRSGTTLPGVWIEPGLDSVSENISRQREIMRNLGSGFISKGAAQAECAILKHRFITDTSGVPYAKFCIFCGIERDE